MQGCRDLLSELRRAVSLGYVIDPEDLGVDAILLRLESRLAATDDAWLSQVVNATGDVLHGGLGRAVMPVAAGEAAHRAATRPVTIEYDLSQGEPGRREQSVEHLLMDLTGAEAATVVTSGTAAVLLALNTLGARREVVVSRRDLAGGHVAPRLEELFAAAGATAVVVGPVEYVTATHYDNAVSERTGLIVTSCAVNPTPASDILPELVSLGRRRRIPVMETFGRGTFIDLSRYGLPPQPTIGDRVALGADIVIFSGDKLMGGPQAGLMAGSRNAITSLIGTAMHQALRCSKCTIAALETTLRLYRESACVVQDIPTLRALTRSIEDIEDTARRALPALASALGPGFRLSLVDGFSSIEAGTPHVCQLPTKIIVVQHDYMGGHRIAGRFRQASPPIIGRVDDDLFILDARTVMDPLEMVPNWTDELNLA
jgi:L-seryl-tRNA(Ser) seleniumtransferase